MIHIKYLNTLVGIYNSIYRKLETIQNTSICQLWIHLYDKKYRHRHKKKYAFFHSDYLKCLSGITVLLDILTMILFRPPVSLLFTAVAPQELPAFIAGPPLCVLAV